MSQHNFAEEGDTTHPEGSAEDQLPSYGVIGVRKGWVEMDLDGAVIRFADPTGDRILEAAPASEGWRVTCDDHVVGEALEDRDTVVRVLRAYIRDHPTACENGDPDCAGQVGLEYGIPPCSGCWDAADRDQLDQYHRALVDDDDRHGAVDEFQEGSA